MEAGIETGKDIGKSILTDMIIGGLMTTTIRVMKMTRIIGVVKGGCIMHSARHRRFL
jgi:hypothetical protein